MGILFSEHGKVAIFAMLQLRLEACTFTSTWFFVINWLLIGLSKYNYGSMPHVWLQDYLRRQIGTKEVKIAALEHSAKSNGWFWFN